jgi:Ribbon-helix-helix protein, copG family.
MVQSNTNKRLLSFRLSAKAIQLLDALAVEQGISKTAVLELVIRKRAEEVEESMPAVYEVLHGDG